MSGRWQLGCIFSISASPEGSRTVHLFNVNSCGSEKCTFLPHGSQGFPSLYHSPRHCEHSTGRRVVLTPDLCGGHPHPFLYLSARGLGEGVTGVGCSAQGQGSGKSTVSGPEASFHPVGGKRRLAGVWCPPPSPLQASPLHPLLWSPSKLLQHVLAGTSPEDHPGIEANAKCSPQPQPLAAGASWSQAWPVVSRAGSPPR